ncbi:MAG: hypothetical protein U9R16_09550 [Campylobacterota bacterium]|nr:hypothetical protein [Campylobacterota bacterium]
MIREDDNIEKQVNSIPKNILKIQQKLCTFEKDSRNFKKYKKILAKHIKNHTMKRRVISNIKTIEAINDITINNNIGND